MCPAASIRARSSLPCILRCCRLCSWDNVAGNKAWRRGLGNDKAEVEVQPSARMPAHPPWHPEKKKKRKEKKESTMKRNYATGILSHRAMERKVHVMIPLGLHKARQVVHAPL
jgi:hypothetical protein